MTTETTPSESGKKSKEEPFSDLSRELLLDNINKQKAIPPENDLEKLIPEELLKPPGLVGDLAEHIYAGMPRKQPVFAVSSALATISTATINNFKVEGQNTPLGIYQALVGKTFCGKDHPMIEPGLILGKLGLGKHAYSSIASGPALLNTLSRMDQDEESDGPTMLVCMDEFGKALQKAAMDGHSFGSITELMSLYGKGCKTLGAKAYAQEKDCIPPIKNPLINLIAATTPETLIAALSSEAVLDGFLNRFMLINATIETPQMEVTGDHIQLSEQIIFQLNSLKLSNQNNPGEKITIKRGEGVVEMCQEFSNYADEKSIEGITGKLWGRAYQNAVAVAGILAVGEAVEPQNPVLKPHHFEWATTWVKWCVESCITLVKDHVADSKEEAERKKILMLIRNTYAYLEGKMAIGSVEDLERGYAPRAWLLKKSKHSSKSLDEHIKTLIDSGLIWYEERDREYGGKVQLVYYAKSDGTSLFEKGNFD